MRRIYYVLHNPNPLQDFSDVPTGANILVDHCLLQNAGTDYYRLHDLVLEYLQLIINMGGDETFAQMGSSRQARYLSRLGVLHEYYFGGEVVSTGGLYALVALWNSVKKLDGTVDVERYYTGSLNGASEIGPWDEAGKLLNRLVRSVCIPGQIASSSFAVQGPIRSEE